MHFFTFTAASLVMVLTVSAVPFDLPHNDFFGITRQCIPGQKFIDKCNLCNCDINGKGACSRMSCSTPNEPHIDGFTSSKALSCVPGTFFYDNCKACYCQSDKTAVCPFVTNCQNKRSRRSAAFVPEKFPHIDNFDETGECPAGELFYNQCNFCTCSNDGKIAICTSIGCGDDDDIRIDNYVSGKKCPAGRTFYNKCNSCICGADGVSADCTFYTCPEYE